MSGLDVVTQPTLDELHLPIDRIRPNPANIRSELGDLSDLVESIRARGVQVPCLVYPDGEGGYWVIAGHRRLAAALEVGLSELPCVVRAEPDEVTLLELMFTENAQREGLDPMDEARAVAAIKIAGAYRRVDQLAKALNKSTSWVSSRLRLVELPEDLWPSVSAGDVTLGDAERVAALKVADAEKRRLFRQPTQIARAVEEERRAAARKAAEKEYGPLLGPSEIHRIRVEHPWGIVRLGSDFGQLNVPVALHRGACDGHVAVLAFDGSTPQAWCTNAVAHLEAGEIDGNTDWEMPAGAVPVKALGWAGTAYQLHPKHCPHHLELDLPWGHVEVCTNPQVHVDGAELDRDAIIALGAADTEPVQPERWTVAVDAKALLTERITAALAELHPAVRDALAIDWCPPSQLVDQVTGQLVSWLESVAGNPSGYDPNLRHQFDGPSVAAIEFGLQACIDVGAPPPTLDEIRTRIDVITKGGDAVEEVDTDG